VAANIAVRGVSVLPVSGVSATVATDREVAVSRITVVIRRVAVAARKINVAPAAPGFGRNTAHAFD
jgi:hypothetical protein